MFERDWNGDRSRVVNQVHEGCQWVLDGEGKPTRKLDGTCCMIKDGRLWKRREISKGATAPTSFVPEMTDEETGKTVGWLPVGDGPEDRWHRDAMNDALPDGTYELVGPKIQGNPENYEKHTLVAHNSPFLELGIDGFPPRDFDELKNWFAGRDMEGIVFHHPDGRMAKVKLRDFGLNRD